MRLLMKESYTVDYAGLGFRLAAILIDGVILWGINYIITGFWNISSGIPWTSTSVNALGDTITSPIPHVGLRWLTFLIILCGYFIGFWGWRGQTPGKMLTRTRITLLDGSRIGWNRSLIRFIGYLITAVFIFIPFLWIAFDTRRQGIHDKMAGTYVIRIPRKVVEIPIPSAN
jgi:uncharacterized RDD family membrane protein YckC